eukprot:SAG22_NODE_12596_length_436_cov_2.041543_2_plen_79_part_00
MHIATIARARSRSRRSKRDRDIDRGRAAAPRPAPTSGRRRPRGTYACAYVALELGGNGGGDLAAAEGRNPVAERAVEI